MTLELVGNKSHQEGSGLDDGNHYRVATTLPEINGGSCDENL